MYPTFYFNNNSTKALLSSKSVLGVADLAPPKAFQKICSVEFRSEDLAGLSFLNLQVFQNQPSHVWKRVIGHKIGMGVNCPFEKTHTGF
ncbi:hypothetical protein TNCT_433771 [Trichonephila clavata]|uniref:Uncharacterized protein n=1 Tax=Trichonephila clavata TaxID=2740835 RepID=A0A8X6IIP2_TRICU|nr:hypothetical protein TNCT_433771 [Trichonephila clavata]